MQYATELAFATSIPLKLGAGTAVPGVVAARGGAHVTLSDHEGNPQLLENLRHTCTINGVSGVEVMAISWGVFSPTLLQLEPQDVILASDCFYDSKGKGYLLFTPTGSLVPSWLFIFCWKELG